MSGGSYSYFCFKVEEFVSELEVYNSPKRIAFKKLMKLVATACHDIEWVDSCDYGEGGEDKKRFIPVAKDTSMAELFGAEFIDNYFNCSWNGWFWGVNSR
jgi:hypothetical protein